MCRMLCIRTDKNIYHHIIHEFARKCKQSKEFQGDGWGISYYYDGVWKTIKNINPVWEYNMSELPQMNMFLIHARSAFDDRKMVKYNMPFENEDFIFAFNGEIRGVKINVEGINGAEKIFNYIMKFIRYGPVDAIYKAMRIIRSKSEYLRASNIILIDKSDNTIYSYSEFNEDKSYFTMYCDTDSVGSFNFSCFPNQVEIDIREVIII